MPPSKTKKNYRKTTVIPSEFPKDSLDSISTVLSLEKGIFAGVRPDTIKTVFQMQQLSINDELNQHFILDFSNIKKSREYISVSRVVVIYLGLFPKDTGTMIVRLRNEAYKTEDNQIEISGSGLTGGMWGFVGAMNHSMAYEDRDKLFLHICLENSDLKDFHFR